MVLDDICMGRKENIDYLIDTNLYQHNYYYSHLHQKWKREEVRIMISI